MPKSFLETNVCTALLKLLTKSFIQALMINGSDNWPEHRKDSLESSELHQEHETSRAERLVLLPNRVTETEEPELLKGWFHTKATEGAERGSTVTTIHHSGVCFKGSKRLKENQGKRDRCCRGGSDVRTTTTKHKEREERVKCLWVPKCPPEPREESGFDTCDLKPAGKHLQKRKKLLSNNQNYKIQTALFLDLCWQRETRH